MNKISVITVTKNSATTINKNIISVLNQNNVVVEHIIKDANSTDNTTDLAISLNPNIVILKSSDSGIYDAMNQGFDIATGDIVCFLNSDDYFADNNVLHDVLLKFKFGNFDFVYGNINIFTKRNNEVIRHWRTIITSNKKFLYGYQIPHPAFFCKTSILKRLKPPFDPSYKISADLKQQLILIGLFGLSGAHIDRVLTMMASGGESTKSFSSYLFGWQESSRAYKEVYGRWGFPYVFLKVLRKLSSLV